MNAIRSTSQKMALILAAVGLVLGGCGSEDNPAGPSNVDTPEIPTEPSTQIAGTASIPVGANGDLANARVAIYASLADWAADVTLREVAVVGEGASVQFTIPNLAPGTYYLDAWKDVNNDGRFMFPDLYGWYGTDHFPAGQPRPILIADGDAVTLNVQMVQMGTPFNALPVTKEKVLD